MNKEDIKKALECCITLKAYSCKECPYGSPDCNIDKLHTDALNLITEQEKEIELLKAENEELLNEKWDAQDDLDCYYDEMPTKIKQAKIDTLNELRAHLYAVYGTNTAYPYYVYGTNSVPLGNKTAEDIVKNIDELIKEIEK